MNELNRIFSKLSFLENPTKLLKVFWRFEGMMKKRKIDYPTANAENELYLKIESEVYLLQGKKFIEGVDLPNDAFLMLLSREAFDEILELVGKQKGSNPNQFLSGLRKVRDSEVFYEIIDRGSDSFLTNLSMGKLIKIVGKQMF